MTDSWTTPPPDVLYEMRVAAHLLLDDMADRLDWPNSVHSDELNEFIEAEVDRWNDTVERRGELADRGEASFIAPVYLLDKIEEVSAAIRDRERFRDQLITFARTFAIDPESSRAIAGRAGLSHTTIMKTSNEDARRSVAYRAAGVVDDMLESLTPRTDPELYGRLTEIAAQVRLALQPPDSEPSASLAATDTAIGDETQEPRS